MFTRFYTSLVSLCLLLIWLGWFGSADIRWRLFVTGTLMGSLAAVLWIDTLAKCGLRSLSTVWTMAKVFGRSRRGTTLTGLVVFCLLFWLSPFATNPSPYRIHMSTTLVLTVAFLWLQPPFALMLGASDRSTGRALGSASSALYPYRIVALLDCRRTGPIGGGFSLLTDVLRTESDYDWRDVVDSLADRVPLLILDARTNSPIVSSEVSMIYSKPERLSRTIFVVGLGGEAPALFANDLAVDSPGIRTIQEDEIALVLKETYGH